MCALAQEAARELFLLNLGLRTTAEIVQWADATIAVERTPHDLLIEMSTTPPERLDRFISLLSDLKTGSDFWSAVRDAMPAVRDYVASHPNEAERVANSLYLIGASDVAGVPDDFSFIYRFDDEFSLARQGLYGNVDAVYAEFLTALGRFKQKQNPESSVSAKPETGLLLNKPDSKDAPR